MKLNLNAPFFQFINTAFDFVVLNICFILTCLPVFTIGAALTALYTVTMAEAEDKGLPFTKTYFHTFTRCFIRSSLLFAGCICICALLLGTSHLPATGLFAVIFAAAGFLFKIWYPARTFMLLMGCSFLAYCFSFLFLKIFKSQEIVGHN